MKITEPSIEIDDKVRILCKSHTQYQFFKTLYQSVHEEKQVEKLLSCKTCKHYDDDNCYFPKSEIDLIERDKQQEKFKCQSCGNKIQNSLILIQSLYYEAKFNIKLPLICSICHSNLIDDKFMQKKKSRLIRYKIFLIISIYIIIYFFITIISIGAWFILGLLPLLFWVILSIKLVKEIKKIRYLKKGRKYYQKFFSKTLNDREEN